jgi:N6-L-threonylcarbamoyladenine synthase
MPQRASLEFSFSGLKTNVMRYVSEHGLPQNDQTLRDLCAAFQHRVVESLLKKAHAALQQENLDTLVLGGGVAANSALRAQGEAYFRERGRRFIAPSLRACTDNAAMIALAGSFLASDGRNEVAVLTTHPRSAIAKITKKGGGPR